MNAIIIHRYLRFITYSSSLLGPLFDFVRRSYLRIDPCTVIDRMIEANSKQLDIAYSKPCKFYQSKQLLTFAWDLYAVTAGK